LDGADVNAGVRIEPADDKETRDAADNIASGCSGSHELFELPDGTDIPWSLEVDLRNCWPKVIERGLSGKPDFWLDDEGELESLRLRALEKLHFFDGVLKTAEADSDSDCTPGKSGMFR
jgi:hypothetical protein